MLRHITKFEEEIMQIIWQLGRAVAQDVIDRLPDPKPPYNTVSTFVRILEQKGFLGHEPTDSKTHAYFPIISDDLLLFFMKDKQIGLADTDDTTQVIQQNQQ